MLRLASPTPSKIEVAAYEDRANVVISIEDEGPGLRGDSEAVFSAPPRDGHGLGLPLAKHLIELHGGRLEVDSAPGRGTMTMGPISDSMLSVWSSVMVARVSMLRPANA